jgi:hypothetical protein
VCLLLAANEKGFAMVGNLRSVTPELLLIFV